MHASGRGVITWCGIPLATLGRLFLQRGYRNTRQWRDSGSKEDNSRSTAIIRSPSLLNGSS